jgi:anti-sigma B factor antagonist
MPAKPELLVQHLKNVTVVDFGDSTILDTMQVEGIAQQLYDLVDKLDRRQLVLDFSNVRFLSSQTLGVLLTLRKKLQAVKGRMVICGLRKQLYEVFRISKLNKLFEFQPDEEKALNVFGVSTVG